VEWEESKGYNPTNLEQFAGELLIFETATGEQRAREAFVRALRKIVELLVAAAVHVGLDPRSVGSRETVMPLIAQLALEIPLRLAVRHVADARNHGKARPHHEIVEGEHRTIVQHDADISEERRNEAQSRGRGRQAEDEILANNDHVSAEKESEPGEEAEDEPGQRIDKHDAVSQQQPPLVFSPALLLLQSSRSVEPLDDVQTGRIDRSSAHGTSCANRRLVALHPRQVRGVELFARGIARVAIDHPCRRSLRCSLIKHRIVVWIGI